MIRNYDAHSSESVDKFETTDTLSKRPLTEERAEQDNIAMATIIENKDTFDSVPSNTKAVLKEADIGPSLAKEGAQGSKLKEEVESDTIRTSIVIENCDAGKISSEPDAYGGPREEAICESAERDHTAASEANARNTMITATAVTENSSPLPTTVIHVECNDTGAGRDGEKGEEREERDSCDGGADDITADGIASTGIKTEEVSSPLPPTVSAEGRDKGIEEGDKVHQQLPKDILFFMRDQQSQTQLKQVPHDVTVIQLHV